MGVVYTGVVGRYVIPAIRTAGQSIDVVSPYISAEYAQMLMDKARSGITVRIITSDADLRTHRTAIAILKRPRFKFVVVLPRLPYYLLAIVALGLVGTMLVGPIMLLAALLAVLLVSVAGIRRRPIDVRIPLALQIMHTSQLVHVKLYIIDKRVAYAGSANLTFSGMNKNIERIEMKTTPAEVQQEIIAFSNLWGTYPSPAQPTSINWKDKPIFRELQTNSLPLTRLNLSA